MRVVAWFVVFALCGCSLPEGKVVPSGEQTNGSSERRKSDAGIDASTGDAAAQTERTSLRDAASADADTPTADAGRDAAESMSREAMAGQAAAGAGGAAMPAPMPNPKPNGELCRGNEDCANDNCKSGDNGERRCFGALKLDESCSEPYDCDGYSCIPLTVNGEKSVCVDKGACPTQGACFQDFGVAMCQLNQLCNDQSGSFNECYKKACTLAGSSNSQCLAALPAQQSLNEGKCCPSGGVFGGSCNTAPQCGCTDDMKCTVDGHTGKPMCVPEGTVPPGGSCEKPEDCTQGYGCVGFVCKQHCQGPDDTTCPGGGVCKPILFATGPTGAHFCTRPCDAFDPTSTADRFVGCGEGQRCNPAPNGQSDCSVSGTIEAGSSCDDGGGKEAFNVCEPSTICVSPKLVCAPFCRVGGSDCESGDCRSFGATRYFVFETEVGFCDSP